MTVLAVPLTRSIDHELDAALSPFIGGVAGYEYRGHPPGFHAGLPSRSLTVIISLDDPVDVVRMPDPAQCPAALGELVGGLHAAPAVIRHTGTQIGIHVAVTPRGARALFGMPASELTWSVLPLPDVLPRADELTERLRSEPRWDRRFAILESMLQRTIASRRSDPLPEPRPEVHYALAELLRSNGHIDVAGLAREVGWSRRHLSARFTSELGIAPKLMARVVRFERAQRLVSTATTSLGDVAARCGYADQAHMTRDWNQFAGSSPAVWFAAEFPDLQDGDTRRGRRWTDD